MNFYSGISSGRSIETPTMNEGSSRMAENSIEKLREIMECAKDNGVYIGPLRVSSTLHSQGENNEHLLYDYFVS